MPTEAQLIALLTGADTAWTTARGVTRHWRNHTLVFRAFHQHFDRMRAAGDTVWSVSFTAVGEPTDDPILETVRAIAVDRPHRRRRAELLSWRGGEMRPDLIVIDGDAFWARTGSELLTNHGDPNFSHGGTEFAALLQPSAVPDQFALSINGREHLVAGHTCASVSDSRRRDVARAKPGGRLDPFGMIARGDDFALYVDLDIGVLLRVVKLVEGQSAEVCEFTELILDEVLPDGLFAPLR